MEQKDPAENQLGMNGQTYNQVGFVGDLRKYIVTKVKAKACIQYDNNMLLECGCTTFCITMT